MKRNVENIMNPKINCPEYTLSSDSGKLNLSPEEQSLFGLKLNILERIPAMVMIVEMRGGGILYANCPARNFFALAIDSTPPATLSNVLRSMASEDQPAVERWLDQVDFGSRDLPVDREVRAADAQGNLHWLNIHLCPVTEAISDPPARLVLYFTDVTMYKEREEEIRYAGYHDGLTGLYNRTYYEEELQRLTGGRHYPIGVLMIDVDGLKATNDTYGHKEGDRLICQVADALKTVFRKEDIVARIGGDEFVILLPQTGEQATGAVIQRVKDELERRRTAHGKIRVSIGCATAAVGEELASVVNMADARMYAEKQHKKDRQAAVKERQLGCNQVTAGQ